MKTEYCAARIMCSRILAEYAKDVMRKKKKKKLRSIRGEHIKGGASRNNNYRRGSARGDVRKTGESV